MATYQTMQRELFAAVEGRLIEAASTLIATGKCAQIANGFLYGDGAHDPVPVHTLKIDWLRELVDGLDGEPLLVAYEFIEDLRAIRRASATSRRSAAETDATSRRSWSTPGTRGRCRFSPCTRPRPLTGSICSTAGRAWRGSRRLGRPNRTSRPSRAFIGRGRRGTSPFTCCVAAGAVDEMKRDRVLGKMSAQDAFKPASGATVMKKLHRLPPRHAANGTSRC